MSIGKETAQILAGSLGADWSETASAIVSGSIGTITGESLDRLLRSLSTAVQRLDNPTSILGNHDLLRAMRNAKLTAIGAVVRQTQRERGGFLDDSVFLGEIAKWVDQELSRSIKREVDPRYLGKPETFPPAKDEFFARFSQLARGMGQRATCVFARDGTEPEVFPFFRQCDYVAIAYLEHFFCRDNHLEDAQTGQPGNNDENPLTTLQASTTLLAFDEALLALGLNWREHALEAEVHRSFVCRFVCPQTGFFSWFRALVREAIVSDARFNQKFMAIIAAESHNSFRKLSEKLANDLNDIRVILDLVMHEFEALKNVLRNGLMNEDAGLVLRDVSEMLAQANDSKESLRRIIDRISGGPRLDQMRKGDDPTAASNVLALRFTERLTHFVGRHSALESLQKFRDHQSSFLWWQISGDAGQGKSRLALEFVERSITQGWKAGFLRPFDDNALSHALNWTPSRDTLIVIDYVSAPERAERLGKLIDVLEGHLPKDGSSRVRVLVLERQPYELPGSTKTSQDGRVPTTANWHKTLFSEVMGESARRARATVYSRAALHLNDLSHSDFLEIAQSWTSSTKGRPLTDPEKMKLERISNSPGKRERSTRSGGKTKNWHRRPLFAIIITEMAHSNDLQIAESSMDIESVLQFVLDRDKNELFGTSVKNVTQAQQHLALLANMVGKIPIDKISSIGQDSSLDLSDESRDLSISWRVLGYDVAVDAVEYSNFIFAREPDILAEFQLLNHFFLPAKRHKDNVYRSSDVCDLDKFRRLIVAGWQNFAGTMYAFIIRCAEDFPRHPSIDVLLSTIPLGLTRELWLFVNPVLVQNLVRASNFELAINIYGEAKEMSVSCEMPRYILGYSVINLFYYTEGDDIKLNTSKLVEDLFELCSSEVSESRLILLKGLFAASSYLRNSDVPVFGVNWVSRIPDPRMEVETKESLHLRRQIYRSLISLGWESDLDLEPYELLGKMRLSVDIDTEDQRRAFVETCLVSAND